jgi:hypothetical protein
MMGAWRLKRKASLRQPLILCLPDPFRYHPVRPNLRWIVKPRSRRLKIHRLRRLHRFSGSEPNLWLSLCIGKFADQITHNPSSNLRNLCNLRILNSVFGYAFPEMPANVRFGNLPGRRDAGDIGSSSILWRMPREITAISNRENSIGQFSQQWTC